MDNRITIDGGGFIRHLRTEVVKAQTRALHRSKRAKTWSCKVQCTIEIARFLVRKCAWPRGKVPSCDPLFQIVKDPSVLVPLLGENWHIKKDIEKNENEENKKDEEANDEEDEENKNDEEATNEEDGYLPFPFPPHVHRF